MDVITKNQLNRKRVLFDELNTKQLRYDSSIGNSIRCPLCWQLFTPDSLLTDLTLEHVPPTAAAKLISEKELITLTCKKCNHTYGRRYQNDLKNFVRHQLFESGKFTGAIPGKVILPGTETLRCNVIWNEEKWHIVGVPKANNPAVTEQHVLRLNEFVESQSTDWGFRLEGSFEYRLEYAWFSFLHAAYLLACVRTDSYYPFSKAGQLIRELLAQHDVNKLGACIIIPPKIGVGGKPWMAHIIKPESLESLWAKVAGNIVILPRDNAADLSCYKAWQEVSEKIHFGLVPKKMHMTINFTSKEAMLAAQTCLSITDYDSV